MSCQNLGKSHDGVLMWVGRSDDDDRGAVAEKMVLDPCFPILSSPEHNTTKNASHPFGTLLIFLYICINPITHACATMNPVKPLYSPHITKRLRPIHRSTEAANAHRSFRNTKYMTI
jgi:hypothetical protein